MSAQSDPVVTESARVEAQIAAELAADPAGTQQEQPEGSGVSFAGAAGFADAEAREILNLLDSGEAGGSCCGGSCCA